jgi:hypothetical protein
MIQPLKGTVLNPQRSRARWVLDLEPAFHPAGAVAHVSPLGHNPFEVQLAGVPVDGVAVAIEVLIEDNALAALAQKSADACESSRVRSYA